MVKILEQKNLISSLVPKPIKFTVTGSGIDTIFDKQTEMKKSTVYLKGTYVDESGEPKEINFRLNVTNLLRLKNAGYTDTDDLEGCVIDISPEKVDFKGKKVSGLRITGITDVTGKFQKIKE